jgi:hypothetical protein
MKLSSAQREMIGRILSASKCFKFMLGLQYGPRSRTYKVLLRDGLVQENRRMAMIGIGREIIVVKLTKAGRAAYSRWMDLGERHDSA